ncbi:MAG TPA: protein kinase [Thermoanaerobaculia bacterium]|nr:protein kinase [Thermoanaerobaculia bacterium]
MSLGTSLGPYEITARIGAGGMGEVWRARDERLGRDVAVKILPAELTKDTERLRRFEQEARAAGSLNHPNLVTTFDSGTHEGQPYIVMELLEGETLRDRLESGRLPLRKVIDYSIQIATGLAAAHEKGIVHRDLKPENLFICKDGRVKILDFGLAKLTATNSSPDAPTQKMATAPGTVMGTVAYMSPEQVRAQNVDHRTDIFSFGTILYEMLTGRRAFEGATAADLMSAILHHDAPDAELPPALNTIVRHCLEKSADERFQSVRDLAFHLQSITGTTSSGKAVPIEPKRAPRRALMIGGAIAVLLATAMAVAHRAGYRWTKPQPAIESASQLTFLSGVETSPSIAPDGKTFIFASDGDIFMQRIDGRNAINLTKDGHSGEPAFSPDGSQIAYGTDLNGGGIDVMGATGEARRRIANFGGNPSWSPDGTQIVCATESIEFNPRGRGTNSELWIIDVKSGAKRLLVKTGRPAQPSWSPHGDRIVYWTVSSGSQRDLQTIDANSRNAKPVPLTNDAPLDWNPIWSADGRYVYFGSDRGGTMGLWRIAVDERSGKAEGAPANVPVPARFAGHFTIDRSGKQLLFAAFERFDSIRRAPLTGGDVTTIIGGSMPIFAFGLSADGQSIAYSSFDRSEDVFVAKSDGSESRQITDSADRKRAPTWSRDGRLLFYGNHSGTMQIWQLDADGSGLTQMTDMNEAVWYPQLSPDGKRMVAYNEHRAMLFTLSSLPMRNADVLPDPPPGSAYHFVPDNWSPDSRYIAGGAIRTADDSPQQTALVYDTVTRKYEVISANAIEAGWLPDGKSMLLVEKSKLKKLDLATRKTTDLPVPMDLGTDSWTVAASPDAKFIYWTEKRREADIWRVTLAE